MPIFVSGALQASVMTGLHVCWGLLCSEGVEKRSWPLLLSVTLTHLVSAQLSHVHFYDRVYILSSVCRKNMEPGIDLHLDTEVIF